MNDLASASSASESRRLSVSPRRNQTPQSIEPTITSAAHGEWKGEGPVAGPHRLRNDATAGEPGKQARAGHTRSALPGARSSAAERAPMRSFSRSPLAVVIACSYDVTALACHRHHRRLIAGPLSVHDAQPGFHGKEHREAEQDHGQHELCEQQRYGWRPGWERTRRRRQRGRGPPPLPGNRDSLRPGRAALWLARASWSAIVGGAS